MSRYGLAIRNNRTGQMMNITHFAKVFHQFSGRADGGYWHEVPTMTHLQRPYVVMGNAIQAAYSGSLYGWRKPVSDFGLQDSERCWHAVTPIFEGNINNLEGDHNTLASCAPTMCIFNPDDRHFYSSRSAVFRRTDIVPHVVLGAVYE